MNIVECKQLIESVKKHGSLKELDFLNSIVEFSLSKGRLTPGQESWYGSLQEKYSEQKIAELLEWEKKWGDSHRKTAIRVAAYYSANPPYFQNYVSKIESDPKNFILSKREWDKFCENKYAKKIRAEYDSDPKYKVGQLVQIRKTNKVRVANGNQLVGRVSEKFGFVMKVDARQITRAAKGSRVYSVLLTGATSPIFCHEADIKNARRKKN